VVKVASHKTASPPQTDGSIVFTRWRQCAFPCGQNWRQLANTIELVLPSVNPSPKSKWQIDQFIHSCTDQLQWAVLTLKLLLALGIWIPSNTWFRGPIQVLKPNGISIGSAIFAGLTSVTDRQTDRPHYSVGNNRLHLRM